MSATTPLPESLRDDEDLSALGLRMNVCMNLSDAFISLMFARAVFPAQSGSVPMPSAPCGNTHVSAKVSLSNDLFNHRTGSFGWALSTRRSESAGSPFSSQSRFFQPNVIFHKWPQATVSIA